MLRRSVRGTCSCPRRKTLLRREYADDQAARHAQHDFLHQSMMSLLERRQPHVTQQVFAQPPARDVGVQQELMLDVVAHALAQPVAAVRQILAEPSIGDRSAVVQLGDFLLQLRVAHRFHDAARVHALLREHFDLLHVDLPARAVDRDADLELGCRA